MAKDLRTFLEELRKKQMEVSMFEFKIKNLKEKKEHKDRLLDYQAETRKLIEQLTARKTELSTKIESMKTIEEENKKLEKKNEGLVRKSLRFFRRLFHRSSIGADQPKGKVWRHG